MTDTRPCTCAPDERPYPCQHQYALGLCRKAEIRSLRIELDRCIAQIADLTKIRLEDELVHGNIMGRIAVALFGDQNNRTDEECVARAAEIGYELSGAKQRAERASELVASTRAQRDELQREQEHLSDMVSAVQELEKQSCAIIRAVSDDVPITTPTRDYSALSPMDCYEAGLLDGGAAVRAYIHAAIDTALGGK